MATQTGKKPLEVSSSASEPGAPGMPAEQVEQTDQSGRPPRGWPSSRFRQRLLYISRHPIDAVWGWLSSVRTAILLIASIAVICLIGIYFVQAPGEVLNDPNAYAAWVQQNDLPRYGSLTPTFDWLRFFTIFSSWYFLLLLSVLSLSIVVCTLNRAPAIWQNFRHPLIQRSERFYQNALERGEYTRRDAVTWTEAEFRRRRYRVRSIRVGRPQGSPPSIHSSPALTMTTTRSLRSVHRKGGGGGVVEWGPLRSPWAITVCGAVPHHLLDCPLPFVGLSITIWACIRRKTWRNTTIS